MDWLGILAKLGLAGLGITAFWYFATMALKKLKPKIAMFIAKHGFGFLGKKMVWVWVKAADLADDGIDMIRDKGNKEFAKELRGVVVKANRLGAEELKADIDIARAKSEKKLLNGD